MMVVMVMDVGHVVVMMVHHLRILEYLYFLNFRIHSIFLHVIVDVLDRLGDGILNRTQGLDFGLPLALTIFSISGVGI